MVDGQDDLFPVEEGIPYCYQGERARLKTVRRAIKRTEQELYALLDTWALRSYADYEWLEKELSRRRIDPVEEYERAGARLSYMKALEFGLQARKKGNG